MNQSIVSPRAYRSSPGRAARVALLVVLASEAIFFTTLLSAYFYLRQSLTVWPVAHGVWSQLALPLGNTLLLLLSAVTMSLAVKAVQTAHQGWLKGWLGVTLALGLVFVALQVAEFSRSGMRPNDQAFGGVFFTLMGFHALHIIAGVIMLANILWRAFLGDFTPRRHVAVQIGSWFWYFIVGVWVVLFIALFLV